MLRRFPATGGRTDGEGIEMSRSSPFIFVILATLLVPAAFVRSQDTRQPAVRSVLDQGPTLQTLPGKIDTLSSLSQRIEEMERLRASRVDRIRGLLKDLKQKVKDKPDEVKPIQVKPARAEALPIPPASSPMRLTAEPPVTQTKPVAMTLSPPGPVSTERPPKPEAQPEVSVPDQAGLDSIKAETASSKSLTGTVDRLGLANNLYAQGDIKTARSIYEELARLPHEEFDRVWVNYQLASCYRLTGSMDKARKYYRHVASFKGDSYWPSRAIWWLDYLTRFEGIQNRYRDAMGGVEQMRKEVDELRNE